MSVEWWEYATDQEGGIAEWLNGIEEMEGHTVDSVSVARLTCDWVVAIAKVIKEEEQDDPGS